MHSRLIAGALLLAAFAAHAQTNVYRWVDKEGKVHFSDTPPPEEAKDVSQKRMGGYVEESQLPYATQMAMKSNPVVLFTAKGCGTPCDRGRELLSNRGVPFSERNAQASTADMDALRKLAGDLEVPLLLVGENKVKGFDEDSWNSALDAGGYPRTRLPSQPPTRGTPEAAPKPPPGGPGPAGSAPAQ
ncbi:MAG TPA: glutaredoxin family protein [Usitatibacter sp.]|nr:glutaredoxin family protein [Usitatibacter sp.]